MAFFNFGKKTEVACDCRGNCEPTPTLAVQSCGCGCDCGDTQSETGITGYNLISAEVAAEMMKTAHKALLLLIIKSYKWAVMLIGNTRHLQNGVVKLFLAIACVDD